MLEVFVLGLGLGLELVCLGVGFFVSFVLCLFKGLFCLLLRWVCVLFYWWVFVCYIVLFLFKI